MAENGKMETRDGREMKNGEGRDRRGDAAARADIDRILTRELGAGSRIPLEGAPNTRDLGGYRGAGGRMVKRHRLIRSGALFGLAGRMPGSCGRITGWQPWWISGRGQRRRNGRTP